MVELEEESYMNIKESMGFTAMDQDEEDDDANYTQNTSLFPMSYRIRDSERYSLVIGGNDTKPLPSLQHNFACLVQLMKSRYEVFDTISQWTEKIEEARDKIKAKESEFSTDVVQKLRDLLDIESKTWNLVVRLYYYRLTNPDEKDIDKEFPSVDRLDEQPAVDFFIETNQEIHELNIILKWLESAYAERTRPSLTPRFVSWEQTYEALQRDAMLGSRTNEKMVDQMDPDAPLRQKKELHILDQDEELNVQKAAFHYIRSGQFQKALTFLTESGHIAKAAGLNGGVYTVKVPLGNEEGHGVRGDDLMDGSSRRKGQGQIGNTLKFRVLGNKSRDLWKQMAFKICETKKQGKYENATLGALCGHRKSVLPVAVTWEDKLWTYVKCVIDIRLEEELRKRSIGADYLSMPDEYWSQKLSISECLQRIDADMEQDGQQQQNSTITTKIFQLVQKQIMLDDVEQMMKIFNELVPKLLTENSEHPAITGQISRFLTHLILVLGIVGMNYDEELMDFCSEAYVKVLVQSGQFIYIPFYVNCMSSSRQIPVILDQIDPTSIEHDIIEEDIESFIQTANLNGLNVLDIGIAIVRKLFSEQEDFNVEGLLWISGTYEFAEDRRQVSLALLHHTLIICRKYLALGNIPKIRELLKLINKDCFADVASISDKYEETLIKEYTCYNSYMAGEDFMQMWRNALTQKPVREESLAAISVAAKTQAASFGAAGAAADCLLAEKKARDFENLEAKWNKAVGHYLDQTIESFMKVLKFPNGWLMDCVDVEDVEDGEEELLRVNFVRKTIIRKVVFVLIKLIQESKTYEEQKIRMRDLVGTICEDSRHILKEFTPDLIASIFKAVEKSTRGA